MAERPGPPANLPPGPSHKLSANYYHTRDARREVAPPNVLADGAQKVIGKINFLFKKSPLGGNKRKLCFFLP